MTDETSHGLAPSGATAFATLGAFIATTVVFMFHRKGIDFPAGYEAGMGAALTVLFTYGAKLGRRPRRKK